MCVFCASAFLLIKKRLLSEGMICSGFFGIYQRRETKKEVKFFHKTLDNAYNKMYNDLAINRYEC